MILTRNTSPDPLGLHPIMRENKRDNGVRSCESNFRSLPLRRMTNLATTRLLLLSLTSLFMFSKARSLFNSARIMPTYNGPTLPTAIHASQNLPSSSGSKEEGIFANGCFWGGEVSSYFSPQCSYQGQRKAPRGEDRILEWRSIRDLRELTLLLRRG